MKAVMISIQPKWVEKIANGNKTIEVRKTRPKIDTPFKCYIYETKCYDTLFGKGNPKKLWVGGGKVIGEFVCDMIDTYFYGCMDIPTPAFDGDDTCIEVGDGYFITCGELEKICLTYEQFDNYGKGKTLYGWHISNLVIYDEPKELSEFEHDCNGICLDFKKGIVCKEAGITCNGLLPLTRPPQSWCYIEEKE